MKLSITLLIVAALFAVALGVRPTPPRKCDYRCTKLDETICATNGICQNRFPSECQMEKYNCLYPQKAFIKIDDWKCSDQSLPQCTLGEL